jgi:hypothetical protein
MIMEEFNEDISSDISYTGFMEEEHRGEQRNQISACLGEIVVDVKMTLADAGLSNVPLYLAIPLGGPSLLSIISPVDPSDSEWAQIEQIVCQIVGRKIGSELFGHEMPCAAAGGRTVATHKDPNA